MARTSARDRKRFNWWRTIAIAAAIAIHAGVIVMLLAPAAPPEAKEAKKQNIVRVEFIPPPPPPPVQEQSAMSTPAEPPRPPAPPPPPADIAPSADISYKNRNPPKYPIEALRQGHQGEVILDVTIDASGNVLDVKVEKSSGYRELDRAAVEAARKWRFNPGLKNGKPVGGVVRIPVNFSLQGVE